MAGPYRIELLRAQTQVSSGLAGYRLQVTAQNPLNLSEKIFVYRRTPSDNDVFEGICTPAQLTTLPVDDPDEDYTPDPTRFRKATFDRTYTLVTDSIDGWDSIHAGVDELLDGLDAIDRLTASTTFLVGTSTVVHTTSTFIAV